MTVSEKTASAYGASGRLHRDPILILVLVLVAIGLLSKLTQGRELVSDSLIFNQSMILGKSLSEQQSPIELGALEARFPALKFDLDFKVADATGHPNLLQTDTVNQGLRLELSGRVLALIVGSPRDGVPYQISPISTNLSTGTWHHLTLRTLIGRYIDVTLDGILRGIVRVDKPFSLQDIRIGAGFDDARRFQGELKNIQVSAGSSFLFRVWFSIVDIRFAWYLGLFAIVLLQRFLAHHPLLYAPASVDIRQAAVLRSRLQQIPQTLLPFALICLAVLLNVSACLYSAVVRHFLQESEIVTQTLLPGFERLEGRHRSTRRFSSSCSSRCRWLALWPFSGVRRFF